MFQQIVCNCPFNIPNFQDSAYLFIEKGGEAGSIQVPEDIAALGSVRPEEIAEDKDMMKSITASMIGGIVAVQVQTLLYRTIRYRYQ